jgi:hypothetical protein
VEFVEEKTQVNTIKKDISIIYGEGVGDTEKSALATAEEFLLSGIKKYIQEEIPLVEAGSISLKEAVNHACKIQFKRGIKDRIFLYIAKENIRENTPCGTAAKPQPAIKIQAAPEVIEQPVVIEAPVVIEEPVAIEAPVIIEEPVVIEELKTPVVSPVIVEEPVAQGAKVKDKTILDWLVSSLDRETLISRLKEAKDDHKVMWGEVKSSINPNWYVASFPGDKNNKVWFIIYE